MDKSIEQELKELEQDNKVATLESLITAGTDAKIPIIVEYLGSAYTVDVKPLNAVEMNYIQTKWFSNKDSITLNMCLKGMLKPDGSNFSEDELLALPNGVIQQIADKINEISGNVVSDDEKQNELLEKILGF